MSYLYILAGFALLVAGADYLVKGASSLAKRLKLSELVIGLTIVSIGTSAPELSVNILASLKNSSQMAVGNIIGSNLFNLLVVLALSALIRPVKVNSSLIKGEIPFLILATVVLLFLAGDSLYSTRAGELSSGDGAILILLFIAFLYYLFRSSRAKEDLSTPSHKSLVYSWGVTLIMVVGGFAALLWGGEIIVKNAIVIAQNWGISEATIGLTVVAVGTSLPEMATSIVAAIKGRSDIAVGNVIGSNILNILMILGLSSLIAPLPFSNESIAETVLSLGATVVVLIAARVDKNRNIGPLVGTFLLLLYMATMLYIFSR